MSYERLAYDEHDSAQQMSADCTACASALPVPRQRLAVTATAPSLAYDARETPKPTLEVSQAAAHLASALHLHLD